MTLEREVAAALAAAAVEQSERLGKTTGPNGEAPASTDATILEAAE